jgi:hypothetical protein
MAKFEKGNPGNLKGRGRGTPNVTTREARLVLNNVLFGELENIKESLQEVRTKDHARYLDCVSKLLSFVIPRKTDLTTDDKPVQPITGIQIIIDDTTT